MRYFVPPFIIGVLLILHGKDVKPWPQPTTVVWSNPQLTEDKQAIDAMSLTVEPKRDARSDICAVHVTGVTGTFYAHC